MNSSFQILLFFKDFIYFRERGRKRERQGAKHQCARETSISSHTPPTGELIHNPGMCPEWESNWQPHGSQARPQPTEPPSQGSSFEILNCRTYVLFF